MFFSEYLKVQILFFRHFILQEHHIVYWDIYFVHIIVIMTKIKYMGQIFASLSLETAFLTIITIVLSAVIVGVLSRNKYVARYIFLIKH